MSDELVFDSDDWPYGLRCMDCDHIFEKGELYSKRLEGIDPDGVFLNDIVCVPCGLGVARQS